MLVSYKPRLRALDPPDLVGEGLQVSHKGFKLYPKWDSGLYPTQYFHNVLMVSLQTCLFQNQHTGLNHLQTALLPNRNTVL